MSFEWPIKKLLGNKANFEILEGFIYYIAKNRFTKVDLFMACM
jgi:hypothetical protein